MIRKQAGTHEQVDKYTRADTDAKGDTDTQEDTGADTTKIIKIMLRSLTAQHFSEQFYNLDHQKKNTT